LTVCWFGVFLQSIPAHLDPEAQIGFLPPADGSLHNLATNQRSILLLLNPRDEEVIEETIEEIIEDDYSSS